MGAPYMAKEIKNTYTWPYSSRQIAEIAKAEKYPVAGDGEFFPDGGSRKRMKWHLDLVQSSMPINMRYHVSGSTESQYAHNAALLLDNQRIRGIDHCDIERRKMYKTRIPKGWHENVIDPSLAVEDPDHNRHIPLPDFSPIDLHDFHSKCCKHWNIRRDREEVTLW